MVPVTLALLCLTHRCGDLWRCSNITELRTVLEGLQDCKIPSSWCGEASILTDVVFTEGYGELAQMIQLLRALVDQMHGRGDRGRSRSRSRSQGGSSVLRDGSCKPMFEGERSRDRSEKKMVHWSEDVERFGDDEEERRGRRRGR